MPKKIIIALLAVLILLVYFKKTENIPKIDIKHIKKINNFYSKNSNITISKYFIKEKYTASIFLESDNFRILAYKKNNLELDVGCNQKYFWYWDSAQSLMYYSDRAVAPIVFNQVLDPDCFLNLFNNEPGVVKINDKKVSTTFDEKNTIYKKIYNFEDKIILKAHVIYQDNLPKEIVLFYTENSVSIQIEIKDVVANKKYDNNVLEIPDIKSEKLLP
jgi:hypothetical protein